MKRIFVIAFFGFGNLIAQKDEVFVTHKDTLPYNKKEEIINDGKRYRIHNNYLTINIGFLESNIRNGGQKTIGVDYQFHLRRQHFQMGVMISGEDFFSNNNNQYHIGYGYRVEKNTTNLAVFAGPTYFKGVEGVPPDPPLFYDGFGGYICLQGVYKFKYDIGLGLELYGDFNYKQTMVGLKILAFFSGAYRGPKKKYNPNVRSENPK